MKDPKLIELLKSLTEKEVSHFGLYLNSPFSGSAPQVIKLFDKLQKYYPMFSSAGCSKQKIFEELYPGKKYNASLINGYYCHLSNALLKYFQYVASEKQEMRSKIDLLNEFRARGLSFDFKRMAKAIEKKLMTEKFDVTVLYSIFYYQTALLNFKTESMYSGKHQEQQTLLEDYNKFLLYLVNIFVAEYLNAKICYFNDCDYFAFDTDNLFTKLEAKKVLINLLSVIAGQNPFDFVHKMNLAYLKLLETEDIETYYHYKKTVLASTDKFKNDELEMHLNFLKSYCIEKCYQLNNREIFTKEYIELEFYILHEKLFQNKKTRFLQIRSYRNILLFLVNRKEIKKIHELSEYYRYIHPTFRTSHKNFTLAYLHYCTGDNDESIKCINRVGSIDKQLCLDCDFLKLKIYFDRRNYLKGFDKIHSTRRVINKNKSINEDRKYKYRVFLNYLEKLFKRMEHNDEAGMYVLLKEISNQNTMLYSEWFIEKYNEFFGRNFLKKSS
jgi:hypothetical protein